MVRKHKSPSPTKKTRAALAAERAAMPVASHDAAEASQAEAAHDALIERLLASAMGLPRVCVFKVCRRAKRCFGAEPVCLEHHRGLAKKRWRAAAARLAGPGSKPAR
jgi:hypothetical protein